MKFTQTFLLLGAMVLFGTTATFADHDVDLHVNGDFRGAAIGAATAPGWTADAQPGSTRIVQGDDWDEFAVEIAAPAGNAKSVCSEFFPVMGQVLKLKTMLRGNGTASVGFLAFDAARQPLAQAGRAQGYQVSATGGKTRNYFNVNPQVKFIRICLTANPGSTVSFGDIDAEFNLTPAPAQAVTPVSAQPAAPVAVPPVQPVAPAVPAVQSAPAPVQMGMLPLIHDKFYSLKSIGQAEYQVTLPVGSDIDFKLEEDADKGGYWSIESYDPMICRVKMDHDREGIWPFRYDEAEIELKGLTPGSTRVVFNYPGKRFVVMVTVR